MAHDSTKHTDSSSGKEHVSRAKDPAIVARSQKPIGWISGIPRIIGGMLAVVLVVAWLKSCGDEDEPARSEREGVPSAPATPRFTEAHETRKIAFKRDRAGPCLRGWVGDPVFYTFGGDGDITIEHEESGRTFRHNKTGWVGGRPGTLPVGNLAFCPTYPGSADSVHVVGLWRKTNY